MEDLFRVLEQQNIPQPVLKLLPFHTYVEKGEIGIEGTIAKAA
jgi:hypothetical protein